MTNRTVAEAIAAALRRHGVQIIFGQSLPSAVILACEAIGIRQLAYRQENMGGAMADGYARVSGRIGVVCAQNGPAATLLVPPLAEALKASIPVVALVQDVERPQVDRNAFQEIDHVALFASCAKWVRRMTTADRVDDYVDAAFVAAGSGRPGPAVLLLPADLLREPVLRPARRRQASFDGWPIDRTQPPAAVLDAAADAVARARLPVVVAGGGAVSPTAAVALSRLQEKAHLPVFTTNMGKGAVAETHELSCGVLGALNGPRSLGYRTRSILDEADLVLMVGTRTNQNGTDGWRLVAPEARVVHIDVDPGEVGRTYEAMRLVGDATVTVEALTEALLRRDLTLRAAGRSEHLVRRIGRAWERFENDRASLMGGSGGPVRPERVMAELQARLAPDTVVVADASYASMWVLGQLRSSGLGQRFITPRGLAGLGWGLPLAIGAKLARPDAAVVALVGDGGFAHSWAELETLVRCGLSLLVVVLNNGVLGYQRDAETVKFGRHTTACHLAPVDHAAIAKACGCGASVVTAPGEIAAALDRALASNRPWLIDVATDPDAHPPISLYHGTLDREPARPAGVS